MGRDSIYISLLNYYFSIFNNWCFCNVFVLILLFPLPWFLSTRCPRRLTSFSYIPQLLWSSFPWFPNGLSKRQTLAGDCRVQGEEVRAFIPIIATVVSFSKTVFFCGCKEYWFLRIAFPPLQPKGSNGFVSLCSGYFFTLSWSPLPYLPGF